MRSAAAHEATHVGQLHRYVPWTGTWTNFSGKSTVLNPAARAYHTLASSAQGVYLFGGTSSQGEGRSDPEQLYQTVCGQQCRAAFTDCIGCRRSRADRQSARGVSPGISARDSSEIPASSASCDACLRARAPVTAVTSFHCNALLVSPPARSLEAILAEPHFE